MSSKKRVNFRYHGRSAVTFDLPPTCEMTLFGNIEQLDESNRSASDEALLDKDQSILILNKLAQQVYKNPPPPNSKYPGRFLYMMGHLGSNEYSKMLDETTPKSPGHLVVVKELMNEMRTQNFDVIRFATYRTSSKLRFIQKKTNLNLVDIWNVIEAFRENGLNALDSSSFLSEEKLSNILVSIFSHLNKRLPSIHQISEEESVDLLQSWLTATYDKEGKSTIRVISVKVALATMCAGKLVDKLRYIFTQISDSSGVMVRTLFNSYLQEVLMLPAAVFEAPSFGYSESAAMGCFDAKVRVSVNDFLDTLMSENGPPCLMWLPIFHRMAAVENGNVLNGETNLLHPVQCEGCHRDSFTGFRYKCQRCYDYHLCQDCFWRGRTSGNHNNDHEMKEYSSYKSPTKLISHKLRNSFRCAPVKTSNKIPRFPETPEKTLDLSNIVPPSPLPMHNGFPEMSINRSIDLSSLDGSGHSIPKSPNRHLNTSLESSRIDDEHRLIARYAARLAADSNNGSRSPTEVNYSGDTSREQRDLISQLELKNREIMREIQRLRIEQQEVGPFPILDGSPNPTLLAELRMLRQRKDELETRMSTLQESRRGLMVQLESLMKLLKNQQGSPRSTPSSPRSRVPLSPPHSLTRNFVSSPTTPGDSLSGLGGDVRQAFSQTSSNNLRTLRTDLLLAADSVTNAMSSLVKELNSEASDDSDDEVTRRWKRKSKEFEDIPDMKCETQEERIRREVYIFNRQPNGPFNGSSRESTDSIEHIPKDLNHYYTDNESYLHSDAESYIRTDDEEGGGTDWEENMKRWVNR